MNGVWSEYPIEVVWEGGKRFRGGKPGGPTLVVDGSREAAPSPVEALIVALGSCSAIDIGRPLPSATRSRTPPSAIHTVRVISELGLFWLSTGPAQAALKRLLGA